VRCLNRMHETIPEARATGRVRIGDAPRTGIFAVDDPRTLE